MSIEIGSSPFLTPEVGDILYHPTGTCSVQVAVPYYVIANESNQEIFVEFVDARFPNEVSIGIVRYWDDIRSEDNFSHPNFNEHHKKFVEKFGERNPDESKWICKNPPVRIPNGERIFPRQMELEDFQYEKCILSNLLTSYISLAHSLPSDPEADS